MKSRVYASRMARNGSHTCTFPCVNVNSVDRRKEAELAFESLKHSAPGFGPLRMAMAGRATDLAKLNASQTSTVAGGTGPGSRGVMRKRCDFIPASY